MYPRVKVDEALALRRDGESIAAISRRVGVARSTVRAWLRLGDRPRVRRPPPGPCHGACAPPPPDLNETAYAYLLGQYLGDGCISGMGQSFRLRLTCCDAYPGIMDECTEAIELVDPESTVRRIARLGCTEVYSTWRHWPCLLPHGVGGVKHRRSLAMTDWQRRVALDVEPRMLLRGLIHSDGWRGVNRVRGANGQPYEYSRYMFSNRSDEIRALFVDACAQVGVEARRTNRWNVAVSTRCGVAVLDEFIGPKR